MPTTNNVVANNAVPNSKPARNRQAVIDKLNNELRLGRILGPYQTTPLENATFSPLYAIPKSEPNKFRLIHDLSKPKGQSVNDNIPDQLKSVEYCTVIQVAEFLRSSMINGDSECFMAKVDLADAYRCCPIHKDDWRFLGMQFEDKLFIDTCLPMGLGTSCAIFQSISDSLSWIFSNRNPECTIYNYIDDFLTIAPTESKCKMALEDFLQTLKNLGFPVSEPKTVHPCTRLDFLGLGIDSKTLSFYVPQKKRDKISQEINLFLASKHQRVHAIQKLVGKLTFLCTTFLPGKSLLAGLYSNLSGVLSSHAWALRRINSNVREDLLVWLSFLAQTEGKPFKFLFPDMTRTETMISDASGSIGYGCVFGNDYFSGRWNDKWWSEQNIALLELMPIYIGIKLWQNKISNTTLTVISDNMSVVAMVNAFYSREKIINKLLKDLALFCMKENIVIRAQHIAGVDNILCDRLSRGMNCDTLLSDEHILCELPNPLQPSQIKQALM